MTDYEKLYADHLATWGRNCGAPLAVYQGQLDKLLSAARRVAADIAFAEGKRIGFDEGFDEGAS